MAGDWLTLILVRIVTSAIRRLPTLSSIGMIITKIKAINVKLSPACLPMRASIWNKRTMRDWSTCPSRQLSPCSPYSLPPLQLLVKKCITTEVYFMFKDMCYLHSSVIPSLIASFSIFVIHIAPSSPSDFATSIGKQSGQHPTV